VLLSLSLNGLFGTVVSDLVWSFVVLFASALVATLGLSLTIPLAMISDAIFGKQQGFTARFFGGSALVLAGFTLVNITSNERAQSAVTWVKSKLCESSVGADYART